MKRILIISHSSELGGAERSMLDLFDAWKKEHKDLSLHFIVKGPVKEMGAELKRRGWDYTPVVYSAWSRRVPLDRAEDIFRNAIYDTKAVFAVEKVIKKFRPDVVMTNTLVAPWGAMAAQLQKIPHVWFVREYGDLDHGHTMELGRENTFEDISFMSELVVTNSLTLQGHVEQYIDKQKLATVYTPFDITKIKNKADDQVKTPFKYPDSLKLVITGRIAPSKGQALAADAVGKLVSKGANIELCVVGSHFLKEDIDSLNAAIETHDIADRVHLVGHQSNPLPYVKLSDIGIMASSMEAFGRTTFEYLSLGKPVVGANGGATPEMVIDGKNGFIFEPGKPADLAAGLQKYIDNPELVKKHGVQAEKTAVKMMNGEHSAKALYDKVATLLADHPVASRQLPHIARTWLEYPTLAQRYIDESHTVSLKRIVYIKLRQRAKVVVVAAQRFLNGNDK